LVWAYTGNGGWANLSGSSGETGDVDADSGDTRFGGSIAIGASSGGSGIVLGTATGGSSGSASAEGNGTASTGNTGNASATAVGVGGNTGAATSCSTAVAISATGITLSPVALGLCALPNGGTPPNGNGNGNPPNGNGNPPNGTTGGGGVQQGFVATPGGTAVLASGAGTPGSAAGGGSGGGAGGQGGDTEVSDTGVQSAGAGTGGAHRLPQTAGVLPHTGGDNPTGLALIGMFAAASGVGLIRAGKHRKS
jgi:LPXTG-motif cell wall-anchored protein